MFPLIRSQELRLNYTQAGTIYALNVYIYLSLKSNK